MLKHGKSLRDIIDGLPPIPDKPEIVAPTAAQRARWTKATQLYVEHLENFIHEMRIQISHIETNMRVLRFGAKGADHE